MEDAHRDLLTRNMNALMCDLDLIEVLPALQAAGVIKEHHVEDLTQRQHETRQDRVRRLVLLLKRSPPAAFQIFYDTLIDTGQEHLAESLECGVPPGRRRLFQPGIANGAHKLDRVSSANGGPALPVVRSWDDINLLFPAAATQHNGSAVAVDTNKRPDDTTARNRQLPVFDPIEHYANFSTPKGLALILHNMNFERTPERSASDKDRDALVSLLSDFGYEVIVKEDLTAKEMESAMSAFASDARHQTCDSTVVAVMTHGLHGKLYGVDMASIDVSSLVSSLNASRAPALREKPKLFFIQACRISCSDETDRAATPTPETPTVEEVMSQDFADSQALRRRIPADADIFVGFSTTPDNVAYRDTTSGTWYLQTLVEVLRLHAHYDDLLSMMTKVNALVAQRVTGGGSQQVPDPCSRLRKKFYFYVGLSQPPVSEGQPGKYEPVAVPAAAKQDKIRGKCCSCM